MDEDVPDDASHEPDLLGRFTIDERFKFSAPDDEPVDVEATGKNPHLSNTVSTPPNQAPDAVETSAEGTDDDTLIGQTIGNYEILAELGRGGFGTVYKARDTKLQRFAALKFLRFPLDREFRKLFAREAQILANLGKHPSIIQIYSWGEHQGSHYFALEFLDASAESLIEKRGEPLPAKQALEIIADCAGALHYAHEQGVLHRDIKPANILIDRKTGRAKVCDFGLAKFNALGTGTATKTIAGSPPYMAPEQIVGKTMDGRTDIYSLGVTLYEMLSRKLPCTGSSQLEILDKIRNRKSTPLREYRPDLSDSILEIVKQATAFRPEDRFQSAEEMQQAAQGILKSLEKSGSSDNVAASSKRFVGPRGARLRSRSLVAAVLAIGVLIAGAFAGSLFLLASDDGGELWPKAIAAAKEQIDSGEYDDAIAWLELYVQEHDSDDFAHYALGYARLLSNQPMEADDAFNKVSDLGLREEGIAAVKHARLGEESRASLQAAAEHVPTEYPSVLIASLDILNKEYSTAIKRLEAIDRAAFNFEWQRRRYGELIARAYYNQEDYKKAEEIFGAGTGASDGISESVNELYAKMARRQLDEDRRTATIMQIEHVKQIAETLKANTNASEDEDTDDWTSRPFRIRISPASAYNCRLAEESGLVGVFSDLLADSLVNNDEVPIELVDRDYIGDVLYEQQLAELSQAVDRVKLQKMLGARLMIESEFKGLMGVNTVWVKIIDTSTTKFTKVESASFDRRTNAREWARDLGIAARQAIQRAYPIRGILTNGSDGPEINVGKNVGVRAGMKFAVFSAPGLEHRLENVSAVSLDNVSYSRTGVKLEPAGIAIPDQGWYLQQIQD